MGFAGPLLKLLDTSLKRVNSFLILTYLTGHIDNGLRISSRPLMCFLDGLIQFPNVPLKPTVYFLVFLGVLGFPLRLLWPIPASALIFCLTLFLIFCVLFYFLFVIYLVVTQPSPGLASRLVLGDVSQLGP